MELKFICFVAYKFYIKKLKQKLGENIHQDNKKPKDRALFNTVQINENLSDENLQQDGEKNQGFLVYYAKNVLFFVALFNTKFG